MEHGSFINFSLFLCLIFQDWEFLVKKKLGRESRTWQKYTGVYIRRSVMPSYSWELPGSRLNWYFVVLKSNFRSCWGFSTFPGLTALDLPSWLKGGCWENVQFWSYQDEIGLIYEIFFEAVFRSHQFLLFFFNQCKVIHAYRWTKTYALGSIQARIKKLNWLDS